MCGRRAENSASGPPVPVQEQGKDGLRQPQKPAAETEGPAGLARLPYLGASWERMLWSRAGARGWVSEDPSKHTGGRSLSSSWLVYQVKLKNKKLLYPAQVPRADKGFRTGNHPSIWQLVSAFSGWFERTFHSMDQYSNWQNIVGEPFLINSHLF